MLSGLQPLAVSALATGRQIATLDNLFLHNTGIGTVLATTSSGFNYYISKIIGSDGCSRGAARHEETHHRAEKNSPLCLTTVMTRSIYQPV